MLKNPVKYIKVLLVLLISVSVATAFIGMSSGEQFASYQSSLIAAWLMGNMVWVAVSGLVSDISNKKLGMVAVANALLLFYIVAFSRMSPPDLITMSDYIGTPWGMAPQWTFMDGAMHLALGAVMPEFLTTTYQSIAEAVAELKEKRATAVLAEQATAVADGQEVSG